MGWGLKASLIWRRVYFALWVESVTSWEKWFPWCSRLCWSTQPCTCTVGAREGCAPWPASTVLTPTVGSICEGSVSHVTGLHLYSNFGSWLNSWSKGFGSTAAAWLVPNSWPRKTEHPGDPSCTDVFGQQDLAVKLAFNLCLNGIFSL